MRCQLASGEKPSTSTSGRISFKKEYHLEELSFVCQCALEQKGDQKQVFVLNIAPNYQLEHTYLPFIIHHHAPSTIYNSNRLGSREEATVYGIDDGLGANLSSAKEPAVKTFDGILTSLDTVEFQVDIALGVGI